MKRVTALLAIIALLAAPATVLAQEEFIADLSVDAEVPAPEFEEGFEPPAGSAALSADDCNIEFGVEWEGLTGPPVGAHIHLGPEGQPGPIIFPFDHTGTGETDVISGTLTEADLAADVEGIETCEDALDAMRAGNTYVNVHTADNPAGELRGQIVAAVAPPDDDDGATPAPALPDTATAEAAPNLIVWLLLAAAVAFALALFGRRYASRSR